MRDSSWITCLWPGLPRVWAHGGRIALLWAATFAFLLNSAVVVTFVWPEVITPTARIVLWSAVGVAWFGSLGRYAWGRRFGGTHPQHLTDANELFAQAQVEYLRGELYQAEGTLRRLLRANPQDGEARLMLATLMRHTGRVDEARQELKRLEQLEAAGQWRLEIRREYEQLQRGQAREGPAESDGREDMDVVTVVDEETGQTVGASEAA